jgi:predicted ATP-grasp superfamily ATP-dependent carboligase
MQDIDVNHIPRMRNGLLIACFEGWGNALNISMGMGHFLIKELGAEYFGKLVTDPFYIMKERRPVIEVVKGNLRKFDPPGCEFYLAGSDRVGRDIIVLKGDEPDIQWFRFADSILSLCREAGVETVVSCGGMLDNAHYADTMISMIVSNPKIAASLPVDNPSLIDYAGQSSIHSTLHFEAKKRGFDCIGFYCHCPAYLQGITHFGLLAHLGRLLSSWAGFELNTDELSTAWITVKKQIQEAIEQNPELKNFVNEIKKSRGKTQPAPYKKDDKIINLEDYLSL